MTASRSDSPPLRVALVQIDHADADRTELHSEGFVKHLLEWERKLREIRDASREAHSRRGQDAAEIVAQFSNDTIRLIENIRGRIADPRSDSRLWRHVDAALEFCSRLSVNVAVFPELSIPARLLERVDKRCRSLVSPGRPFLVVAGSHYADPAARSVYRGLGVRLAAGSCDSSGDITDGQGYAPIFVHECSGEEPRWLLVPKVAPSDLERREGHHWPPSSRGWAPVVLGGTPLSVLVCSDYVQAAHPEVFQDVKRQTQTVPLILVPAFNPRLENFTSEFRNRWRAGTKTAYANVSREGRSLFFGTDDRVRNALLERHDPFDLKASVMYRVPRGNQAITVADVWLGDLQTRDKLVALAPIISSHEFVDFLGFHRAFRQATSLEQRQDCARRFREGGGLEMTLMRLGASPSRDPNLFREKLELFRVSDPDALSDSELLLLAEAVIVAKPETPVLVYEKLDKMLCDIYALAPLVRRNEGLSSALLDIVASLRPFLSEAFARYRDTSRGDVGEARHPGAASAGRPPDAVSRSRRVGVALLSLFSAVAGGAGAAASESERADRVARLERGAKRLARVIATRLGSVAHAERTVHLGKVPLEQEGHTLWLEQLAELYDLVGQVSVVEGLVDETVTVFASKARAETGTGGGIAGSETLTYLEAVLPDNDLDALILDLARSSETVSGERPLDHTVAEALWLRLRPSALVASEAARRMELKALLQLIKTAVDMLREQAPLAACAIEESDEELSGRLLEAGMTLELLGRTLLRAALEQIVSGRFETHGLAIGALLMLPTVTHGRYVRRRLRELLTQQHGLAARDAQHFSLLVAFSERAIGATVERAEGLLRAINSDADSHRVEQLASEMLSEAFRLTLLLTSIEAFLEDASGPSTPGGLG